MTAHTVVMCEVCLRYDATTRFVCLSNRRECLRCCPPLPCGPVNVDANGREVPRD